MTLRAIIGVHGRFHAFNLAEGLHRRGHLQQLITTYPRFAVRRFMTQPKTLTTIPMLEAWRRFHDRFGWGPSPTPGLMERFDAHMAKRLDKGGNLFIGWSSACLATLDAAKALGMKTIVERGSTHIVAQNDVLLEAARRAGLDHVPVHPAVMEREVAEYEKADNICVPTRFAADTFIQQGIPAEKLLVNAYGVDTARFQVPPRQVSSGEATPLRVLFVGQVGIRKGILELLDAFAGISRHAELRIAGPVEPGTDKLIAAHPMQNVQLLGPQNRDDVISLYRHADVFCLPSLEEGFGMVLLEAMACGLPIIASNVSGGAELTEGGATGRTVMAGDVSSLADALNEFADMDPESRANMGENARALVTEKYSWDGYVGRAVAHYEDILGETSQ